MINLAFIRVKRFKRKDGSRVEYAYIVENRRNRKKKKVKQKFRKYLGRVYRPNKLNNMDFYEFHSIYDVQKYIKDTSKEKMINDLLEFELCNYGFKGENGVLRRDNCFVNIKERRVYNEKDNNVALALNNGLLTSYAIEDLLNFKASFSDEETGYKLAKAFVEAGIKVPKEVFVGIFEKINS